jgi:hypothetical protein
MLNLDFTFSDQWNETVDPLAMEKMSEIDIRYRAALGNLILVVNGVDCSAAWGWIPMLDLAVALSDIRNELARRAKASETFEFTENEAAITIQRSGDIVRITTNYAPCSESIRFSEFDLRVNEFREKVFRETAMRFPALSGSEAFRTLRARTALSFFNG